MAVASLLNMTVPVASASDQSANTQGVLMPLLKYRFRVSFENFGITSPRTELTKQVMSFTRPNLTFESVEIPIYNSRMYIQGKPQWQTVQVEFRDDANGSVRLLVGEQVQKQFDFAEQSSAVSGIDYKFLTRFEALDGGNGTAGPTTLEEWEMYGCFIQEVNYNNFDYNSNDPATITMTIRYDNALQVPGTSGVGKKVNRTFGHSVTG
jgi:hypothetical protein